MSTDWNVHCVDCNETHGFDDANHQVDLMLHLCRNADVIASMAPLFEGDEAYKIEFRTSYGSISPKWFAKHMGHNLMPISEYGRLLDQCHEWVSCSCGHSRPCAGTKNHDGEHHAEKR